jgi:hypothetical protein
MQQNEHRKYHIFGTVPKFNRKIAERGNIEFVIQEVNTHEHVVYGKSTKIGNR